MKIIIQKFIAQSGYCSRRKAEEMVESGKVILVNGQSAQIGQMVDESDDVRINGKRLGLPQQKIYIKLNKPQGYTCTNRKFVDEKNVFALLPREFYGLIIAGRLDKESRGLLLLSNDGDWVLKLTHPRYEHEKKYVVKLKTQMSHSTDSTGSRRASSGQAKFKTKEEKNISFFDEQSVSKIDEETIRKNFIQGVEIGEGDGIVRAKKVKYLGNNKFEVILTEGKKRQIRRMFKVLGFEVSDLQRVQIADIKLDNLAEGKWEYLKNYKSK